MLKRLKILTLFLAIFVVSCSKSITKNIENPFGLCQYNGGLLISNWHQSDYALSNSKLEKKNGFISYLKNGKNKILISKGKLILPAAMAVKNDYLFVADLNRIVVFDLRNPENQIDEIFFQQSEIMISDLLISGKTLFISVRNLNKIYLLDIENPENINHSSLLPYIEIQSPSALLMAEYHLFIATNSLDEMLKDDNSIFIIDDLTNPVLRKLTHHSTLYHSMIFSEDRTQIIFIDYANHGHIGTFTFGNSEVSYKKISDENSCFTDLILFNNNLYINDLINREVVVKELK
jgi:hypothetical protein